MPSMVKTKYNSSEQTRIIVSMTFGNGSKQENLCIAEGTHLYNSIFKELTQEKIVLENEINGL
jgi:hypothetical protein